MVSLNVLISSFKTKLIPFQKHFIFSPKEYYYGIQVGIKHLFKNDYTQINFDEFTKDFEDEDAFIDSWFKTNPKSKRYIFLGRLNSLEDMSNVRKRNNIILNYEKTSQQITKYSSYKKMKCSSYKRIKCVKKLRNAVLMQKLKHVKKQNGVGRGNIWVTPGPFDFGADRGDQNSPREGRGEGKMNEFTCH